MAAASAAATLSASPTTVRPLAASKRRASRRNSESSSTTKTDRDPITPPMIAVSRLPRGRETRKLSDGAGRETPGQPQIQRNPPRRRSVVGAHDLVVAGDENVMGPVDADVVDLVLAVAQAHHPVHNPAGVRGQRRFSGPGPRVTTDDRAGPLLVAGWNLPHGF